MVTLVNEQIDWTTQQQMTPDRQRVKGCAGLRADANHLNSPEAAVKEGIFLVGFWARR